MPQAKFVIIRKCKICGAEFRAKNLDSFYCSHNCSDAAYKQRKREKQQELRHQEIAGSVPDIRDYVSVTEAVAMFAISRTTLYRLIRNGEVPAINIGQRLIRINRHHLEQRCRTRREGLVENEKPLVKTYRLEIDDCYSIGEISEKFEVSPSTVYAAIRKNSIPIRQIGKFVYAPKLEIDNLLS